MTQPKRQLAETIAAMQAASGAVAKTAAEIRAEKQAELDRHWKEREEARRARDSAGTQATP